MSVTGDSIQTSTLLVDQTIRARKTTKIMRDPVACDDVPAALAASMRQMVQEMIEVAGWAPFHKLVHEQAHRQGALTSVAPWRFYALDKSACCALLAHLRSQAETQPGSKWVKAWESKIPRLLAGCGAAVLVTWLPDPTSNGDQPEMTERNIEHIAAASAAVQNLLLAAQARGLHNFWSTGGILKDGDVFDTLGIPRNQMLLAAIFLAHPDQPADEQQPGSLRERRGAPETWSQWVRPT